MDASDVQYSDSFTVTKEIEGAFHRNGYLIVRGLLNEPELSLVRANIDHDPLITNKAYRRDDGEGRRTKVVLWNQVGQDTLGTVARCEKVAGTFEKLLGGELYHYHSKMIMKEARTGGAHVWHQDYGYWYENGCIFPNMGTFWLAVDKADRSNGCLKILVGSHLLGRIDHGRTGDQAGADLQRVKECEKFCTLKYVELDPGDALFFHCNVLHRSDHNNSENRRWAFLVSYNRADNDPVYEHHHPKYTPMSKVPSSAILRDGLKVDKDEAGRDFFHGVIDDFSVKKLTK